MKIIILSDSEQKEGGTNEVIKHMVKALNNNNNNTQHEIVVDYIIREKYLPKFLPKRWIDLFRIFYLYNISKDDSFNQFDVAITLQPDSHGIKHKNHIIYFQHHIKQYYDMFWYSFNQKRQLRKKIIFLLLTVMNRFTDKIYLTSKLKKAHVLVNSQTVGERLKRYNGISNFTIINPCCDIPTDIIETNKVKNNDEKLKELAEINNYEFVILSFSRLNIPQKGIDIILDTALLMPAYHFIIAGPYDPTLETLDRDSLPKNLHLIVKDFSHEEKEFLFRKCDIFLAPYINEDFGITPIEANAYGKPVIYCDDSGEIVNTQKHKTTGYMSQRKPDKIVKGIEYCTRNKDLMKFACTDNASNYTWKKFETSFRTYLFQSLKL